MNISRIIIFIGIVTSVISCKPKAQPIDYGSHLCDYCQMTIVDKQFAAEVVTNKGKAYRYDAIECMLRDQKEDVALYLACDYMSQDKLVDATKATFLISENLPSPMGAFLSAFENKADAEKMHKEKDGKLYDWEAIKQYFLEEESE
ncbi:MULTISPECIES: nitrous oxide reductase accessory protein NosL [Capnocytophaga]|uniref:Copper chaperone NosL n=1 Tax=Capnocytophaga cynodegmi TaxID=28189 RepID=A0A0B7HA65_9FLAO|nr:nitrous oxide reductase accessory protein NosL [Capnocytophaga cynodegmi]CEN34847.1 conserved hypothetical protein [Capnocytophaga cynodegmi]CEN36460.1 conserved hypothetical protein [Capnocytophaga cynodegmi]